MKSVVKNRSCTLRDIAKVAGVSPATASQILNNKPCNYSSEETRERVKQVAKKMGYRTHYGYRLIQGQKTRTAAILVSEITNNSEEHFRELIIELMAKFNQLDYSVYFRLFTLSAEDNLEKVRDLLSRGVEHFVFLGEPVGCLDLQREIEKGGRSLVGLGKSWKRHVYIDSSAGIMKVFRFFLDEGRNFRLVCPEDRLDKNTRLTALQRLFPKLSKKQIIDCYIVPSSSIHSRQLLAIDSSVAGWESAARIVKDYPEVNAIFFMTDYMAIGGANFLIRNGIEVGKDILVAGFNNIPAVRLYPYPISSVSHNLEKVVNLLAEESIITTPCQHVIEPVVHIRTSDTHEHNLCLKGGIDDGNSPSKIVQKKN